MLILLFFTLGLSAHRKSVFPLPHERVLPHNRRLANTSLNDCDYLGEWGKNGNPSPKKDKRSQQMEITCHHPASQRGIPVILNDLGQPMQMTEGLRAIIERLGWSRSQFAAFCFYKSSRSVEKFFQGTTPPAHTLNLLSVYLAALEP
mgnify:CR=1 FL=1|jgi:hypothetical protein